MGCRYNGSPYSRNMNMNTSYCEERAQIVYTKSKLSVRNTAQNGQQHEKLSEAAPEISIYLALYTPIVRNAKSYNLAAALSS